MNARTPGLAALLSLIGCGQMLADVLQLPRLKAAMQLTQVSPAMKVFTAHRGYETYAARFYIERIDAGTLQTIELDRARYQRLAGPYNRRNVYGAAFSYGPLLASDARLQAMHAWARAWPPMPARGCRPRWCSGCSRRRRLADQQSRQRPVCRTGPRGAARISARPERPCARARRRQLFRATSHTGWSALA